MSCLSSSSQNLQQVYHRARAPNRACCARRLEDGMWKTESGVRVNTQDDVASCFPTRAYTTSLTEWGVGPKVNQKKKNNTFFSHNSPSPFGNFKSKIRRHDPNTHCTKLSLGSSLGFFMGVGVRKPFGGPCTIKEAPLGWTGGQFMK